MGLLFVNFWHALTAAGRSFALGASEAWGFWSVTLLLLFVVLFAATMVNGIVWRMIEGRMKPKLRDREAEARLNATIVNLKAQLFDAEREIERLTEENAERDRVIEVERNFNRNWNSDAGQVVAGAGR